MQERGYVVDHSTIQCWIVHYAPRIEKEFRKNKKRTGLRRMMDWPGIPETYIKIRGEWKYLNNIVEQVLRHSDHRFIKRITRPMLGCKSFWSAQATLAGIELWRMLKKGQNKSSVPAWEQFYALALTG